MKQLKFFTRRVETLKATQDELAKKGIAPEHLHIFIKDNVKNRYDGLLLQSEQELESLLLRNTIVVFVILSLFAALAVFAQWISFTAFALLVILCAVIASVLKGLGSANGVKKDALKKVYFLVVDVDENERDVVERVAKNHPDLVAQ